MRATDLIEILWKVRCTLEERGRRRQEMSQLRDIDSLVTLHLRNMGHDPGSSAMDADDLKLALLRSGTAQKEHALGGIGRHLEKVVEIDNAHATPYRVVGRWAEFVNRAVLSPEILPDDPILPVRPWVKARKIDVNDFAAAAQAFVDWTREANEKFEETRGR